MTEPVEIKPIKVKKLSELPDHMKAAITAFHTPAARRAAMEELGIEPDAEFIKEANDYLAEARKHIFKDDEDPVCCSESLPDSGKRREFTTGSVRDIRSGKGRYDLISPFGIAPLAKRLEDGMTKYGERNWEKGQNLMSYLDSAERHIEDAKMDFLMGQDHEEDHIGAAMWNLHAYAHTLHMIKHGLLPAELDDRPFPERVGIK